MATLAGQILGSPAYMSPEQAAGELDLVGPASDIYGLCAILYEILSGRPPFTGRNAFEVLHQVLSERPQDPSAIVPGIPAALEAICLKGLAKAPAERHESAEALAAAVQRWVSELAERRQAEEERERFFALSLDLLAIVDAEGRFRQCSPAWESSLGYGSAELAGRRFVELLPESDRALAAERISAAAPQTFEAPTCRRDGTLLWISWNVTPIAREQCVYIVGRDITELKRQQQLFQGILQSAPDALVLVDRQGRIALVNRQMEQVFGFAAEELLGRPVEKLIPERFRAEHPAHVDQFFAASRFRPMGAELVLYGLRKDGREFRAEIALSPIETADGMLVAASVRDVSAQRRK